MADLPIESIQRIADARRDAEAELKKALSVVKESDDGMAYLPAFKSFASALFDAEAGALIAVCEDADGFQIMLQNEVAPRIIEGILPDRSLNRVTEHRNDEVRRLSIEHDMHTGLLWEVWPDGTRNPARAEVRGIYAQHGDWENFMPEGIRHQIRWPNNNGTVRAALSLAIQHRADYWAGRFQLRSTVGGRGAEMKRFDAGAQPKGDSGKHTQTVPSFIQELPKDALVRMQATTAAFMAEYLPRLEREANKNGPLHDAELLRELVIHQFNMVAREFMAVCTSVEEFEAELYSDIARFVRYGLSQYRWLADPMLEELDTGFTFFITRLNPWVDIPDGERASAWHVGAITGEALSHAALKLRAEAWTCAAKGGFPNTVHSNGASEPSEAELPAPSVAISKVRGRKRGPKSDVEGALQVAEILARVAPGGDWRSNLDCVCEALDEAKVPFPARWRKRDKTCRGWVHYEERANAVKAVEYRLGIAKQRKKTTSETLS